MGTDKREVRLAGEPLLARAVRRLDEAGLAITIVGGLGDNPTTARHLADQEPGAGPMGGVRTALSVLPTPLAIVAVDMPDVSVPLLRSLAAREPAIAAVPTGGGVLQPLHAVWGPNAASHLESAWLGGERSLRRFLETADVDRLDGRLSDELAGDGDWWASLDTPADLERRQSP